MIQQFYNFSQIDMGNSPQYKAIQQFHEDWRILQLSNCSKTLVFSQTTHLISETYWVRIPSGFNIDQELTLYDMRQSSRSGNLVNIMGAYLDTAHHFRENRQLRIVTERLPFNSYDLRQLSAEEAIYLTFNIFNGFQQICNHSKRPFAVAEKNININYFGVPKVWHREQYSLNIPFQTTPGDPVNQYQMIRSIIAIIQAKMSPHNPLPREINELKKHILINFNGALERLSSIYQKLNALEIRRNLMLKIFHNSPPIQRIPDYVLDSLKINREILYPRILKPQNCRPLSSSQIKQPYGQRKRLQPQPMIIFSKSPPNKQTISLRSNKLFTESVRVPLMKHDAGILNKKSSNAFLFEKRVNSNNLRRSSILF